MLPGAGRQAGLRLAVTVLAGALVGTGLFTASLAVPVDEAFAAANNLPWDVHETTFPASGSTTQVYDLDWWVIALTANGTLWGNGTGSVGSGTPIFELFNTTQWRNGTGNQPNGEVGLGPYSSFRLHFPLAPGVWHLELFSLILLGACDVNCSTSVAPAELHWTSSLDIVTSGTVTLQ